MRSTATCDTTAWQSLRASDVNGNEDAEVRANDGGAVGTEAGTAGTAAAAAAAAGGREEKNDAAVVAVAGDVDKNSAAAAAVATVATAASAATEVDGGLGDTAHTGSCYCHCPPYNSIGQCVNMRGVPEVGACRLNPA